jgi:hypothetical protein
LVQSFVIKWYLSSETGVYGRIFQPNRLEFVSLSSQAECKLLILITYLEYCTRMAFDLNSMISLSISGVVGIVGLIIIINILIRRSARKNREHNDLVMW